MTFSEAVNNLTNGKAAKRPSWRGYVKREARGTAPSEWSNSSAYSVGDLVTYGSQVYICRTAISAPSSGSTNTWDSSKWLVTERNYDITFQEADDPTTGIGHDNHETYTFQYTQSVTSGATSVTWSVTAPTNPTLEVDDVLFEALLASDWYTGLTDDFESSRGGGNRW